MTGSLLAKGGPTLRERLELEIPLKEAGLGPGPPGTATAFLELGTALMYLGDREVAVRAALTADGSEEADEGRRALGRKGDKMSESEDGACLSWPESGQCASDWLEAFLLKGDLPAALERLKLEVPAKEARLGPGHPGTVMALLELGSVVLNLGDAEGAVRVARKALEAAAGEGGTGPASHACVAAASFLGAALSEAGRPVEAAAILRRALEAARVSLGPWHPDTLSCLNILAVAFRGAGLMQAGEALMSEALEGLKGRPEDRGRHAALIRCNLAGLLAIRGDPVGAVGILRTAYADLVRLRGPDNPHALTVGSNLAAALLDSGEADQAVALYREILQGMSGFPPEGQEFVRVTMENLARAEAKAGRGGGSH